MFRLVVLLQSCCNILSWQLKPHNLSWLPPLLYILLGLVWYLFCKHCPCLLELVTVWTSLWVLTFHSKVCPKVLLIRIACLPLHPLPHCPSASTSPSYSPGHTGWGATVKSLSTTGRCHYQHTSPSHWNLLACSSGSCPFLAPSRTS